MDVSMAAFRLVHDAPGGATALAPVVGKSAGTLSHEVDPNYAGAKLGLLDAVKLSKWRGDRQVLDAFALELGCVVVPLVPAVAGAEGIASRTARLVQEFGDLMCVTGAATGDGVISDNERERIEREGAELLAALQAFLGDVRALNSAGKDQQRAALQAVA